MTRKKIAIVLNEATMKSKKVVIQVEEIDKEGNYKEEIIGYMMNFDTLGFYIGKEKIHYDEIRHIELYLSEKQSGL